MKTKRGKALDVWISRITIKIIEFLDKIKLFPIRKAGESNLTFAQVRRFKRLELLHREQSDWNLQEEFCWML
jgi:hypothetical protein